MARIFIVDERGARAGDLAAARERFDEANKDAFGADLDVHAHTPQNQIAGINALVATELGEELVRAALYGASINHSVGIFLDSLGSLLDIRRDPETRSRVIGVLSGTAGAVIPAGSLAKNTSGDTFESEVSATIGADGSTTVGFIAKEPGPKDVGVNTLNQIVSVRTGWTSLTNTEAGIEGRDRESDALFRANLKARTAQSSIGSIAALQSALQSAGAVRIKILENSTSSSATRGGIIMPAHSILVIADGGLADDISRAVENHRGMGVNTYTAFEGSSFNLGAAQKINAGRMLFNDTEIGGFDMTGRNVPSMADALNAATSVASFAESGGKILTLHSWDTDSTGFADLGGNIGESDRMRARVVPLVAQAAGDRVIMSFPEHITATPTFTVKYTNGGSETTATTSDTFRLYGLCGVQLSAAIPSTATDVKISATGINTSYSTGLSFTDHPVEFSTDYGSTDAPSVPLVTGVAQNGGTAVAALSLGTITKWQYRRWQNNAYLDSNWVDETGNSDLGTIVFDDVYTGFTNGLISRLELRAVNGSHGETAARSFVFEPSATAPAIQDAHIDGNLLTLTYDRQLTPAIRTTGLTAAWSISASGNAAIVSRATRQQTIGRQAILTLDTAIAAGANWVISSAGVSTNVFGLNGVQQTNFANQAITNDTKGGIPSAPIAVVARRTGTGWRADWASNANGGLAIDRYEISTLPVGSNVWTPWVNSSTTAAYSIATTTIPDRVRVRASNANARSAELLGLLGTTPSALPFARSITQPLSIAVSIHRDAAITTSDFTAIKTSLVDLVNSYAIGDTIYQADLQARVEGIKSIRLASALTATSNGVNVDGVVQNAYNRWTLDPDDISVTFVN